MKRSVILLLLIFSLLLTGCSWMDGREVSVEPHQEERKSGQTGTLSASGYLELVAALEEMIAAGTETAVINVAGYTLGSVDNGMTVAMGSVMKDYPIGAYAVDEIHYELGTSSGVPALAVTITYRHNLSEIQRIHTVNNVVEAEKVVTEALEDNDASVVMLLEDYATRDYVQVVQNYAVQCPEMVMETPQVTESVYGTGQSRVVELIFTYQNSRDSLRQMKNQVKPVFDAAALYVSGDGSQRQKFSQLYAFLMERFDYTIETSITPAYSLLRHGVGDSRAFATVYASMCRGAGLECMIVTGTRSGEPWTWNMVQDNGYYYHVDLLRNNELGFYREFTDAEMSGYVWDYSAYPRCVGAVISEEEEETPDTVPETQSPETTMPETAPTETAETIPAAETEEKIEEF